jgi:hypothetical protein
LAIRQVPDEIAEFIGSVDEIRVVDDFAKNERIFVGRHITLISVTLNGVVRKGTGTPILKTYLTSVSGLAC